MIRAFQENEDDIGALGSILSWDEEEDDEGQAVNHSAAAMNIALRERDSAPGTSAPPDMVQFSMKDGVPQFNFLTSAMMGGSGSGAQQALNTTTLQSVPQGNGAGAVADSSLTLQLPMPTPISKFNDSSTFQSATQQQHQPDMDSSPSKSSSALQPQSVNNSNNSAVAAVTAASVQQMVSQQQTQQGLAATFAQLLAQQAGTLFQQQHQNQQQPQPQDVTQTNQMSNPQSQQQPAETPAQQAQNVVLQQAQQQLQQTAQQAQQSQQTAQQQQNNQVPSAQPQQQQAQVPQLPLPFGNDPNAFIQQLQFAQFQHQLQMQAQQQQASRQNFAVAPSSGNAPGVPFAQTPSAGPVLNARPQQTREGPPPSKRAKKTKSLPTLKPATTTSSKDTKKAAPTPTPSMAKAGFVSASDTDCDGPRKTKSSSTTVTVSSICSNSETGPPQATAPPVASDHSNVQDVLSDSNLNVDDKAQANRDRNREHARNTRLRKKAYLEKLKATVEDLCRERDTLVTERAGAAGLLVEMHNTRTEVLMSFFALRSSNERRRKLWSSILDESCFACIMPVTPYRSFPASEVQVSKCQRTVLGIDAMMADTASLHVLLQSLVDRTRFPDGKVEFRYTLVTEESVVAGNQMMARWVMSSMNATKCGALTEVAKQGMLCCKFNSAHRITGLELMFDVMAFMLQLKQAAGSDSFSVIPNTVQTCQRMFDKPMVMTLANPPYTIVQVNKLWEDMTGYMAEEVVGKKSCSILQGPATDKKALSEMMEEVRFRRPGTAYVRNVKKSGEMFSHSILAFPLSTDSRVTHYLALSNHVERNTGGASSSPTTAISRHPRAPTALQHLPQPQHLHQPQVPLANALPQGSNAVSNGSGPTNALTPQYFVASSSSPAPVVFHPQPQTVESNHSAIAGPMAPPPAQTSMLPPS